MIIFDASTLILIAKGELLDLFIPHASVPVVIPGEVERECCGSKKVLDAVMIQKALEESRIKTVTVKNHRAVAKLQADFCLGSGEAEAIALALNEKAQLRALTTRMGTMPASY